MSNDTTNLERTSLEAHVDLCAMRYGQLDTRLDSVEKKVDELAEEINRSKNSLATTIIAAAGTMVTGIIGLIVTILIKF